MSKLQRTNREDKKQPVMTPKEKKAAKRAKNQAPDPFATVMKRS